MIVAHFENESNIICPNFAAEVAESSEFFALLIADIQRLGKTYSSRILCRRFLRNKLRELLTSENKKFPVIFETE